MLQILIRWDNNDPADKEILDKLRKGFEKMGCWMVELPPKESIYRLMLTLDKENIKTKEGQNGKGK